MTADDLSQHMDDPKTTEVKDFFANAGPPSYDDATGEHHSVPIQAPPEGNQEAIDIRLDDYDYRDNAVNHTESSSGRPVAKSTALSFSPLWMTPAHAAETAKSETTAWSVAFVPAEGSRKRAASLIENLSQNDTELYAETTPSIRLDDIVSALPHPSAVFYPESLRWQVYMQQEGVQGRYNFDLVSSDGLNQTQVDATQLWKVCNGTAAGQVIDQRGIVALPQLQSGSSSAAWRFVEQFTTWESTSGKRLFATHIDELHSIVPISLLNAFRQERMSNPRPGLTGYTQFYEAASTLLKIVGNAANGEVRPLTTNGKTISVKLGLDQHAEEILTSLGFQRDSSPEVPIIKPPDMTSAVWQLRMRRAWVELSLWFAFQQRELLARSTKVDDVACDLPYCCRFVDCDAFLQEQFGDDGRKAMNEVADSTALQLRPDFHVLGANSDATDELLDRCYIINSDDKSLVQQAFLLTALTKIVEVARKDSDILQTRIAMERSKGLFTITQLGKAFGMITGTDLHDYAEMAQVDDYFIAAVYRSTGRDVASERSKMQELKDALALISLSRNKPALLEETLKEEMELSIDKAYEILEVQHDTDDDFIVAAYQLATTESRFSAEQCTEALRIIGEHRKSSTLRKTYRAALGLEEEEKLDIDPSKPAGLENIGNTCYLNSVLQYFYAIKPLRERVLDLREMFETKGKADVGDLHIRVGGRQISQREISRSIRFVELLAQLFSAMKTSPSAAVTPERELAYLALVSSQVEEREAEALPLAGHEAKDSVEGQAANAGNTESITAPSSTLFDEPATISSTDVQPDDGKAVSETGSITEQVPLEAASMPQKSGNDKLTEIGQRKNSLMQLGAQQDVSECLDNVMFQIETALAAVAAKSASEGVATEGTEQQQQQNSTDTDEAWVPDGDLLRRLFLGRTNQRLEMLSDPEKNRLSSVHMKREVFKILPVDVVEEGRDIYDGLDGFFDDEILTGTGGESMRRMVTLTDAPAIIQIQLQRVQYDRVRGVFKSQAHLEMGETLFMDRYMDFDASDPHDQIRLQKRKQARDIRRQITELKGRREDFREKDGGTVSRTLEKTAGLLESFQKGSSVLQANGGAGNGGEDQGEEKIHAGGIPSSLLEPEMNEFLRRESKLIDEKHAEGEAEMKRLKERVETLWSDERRVEYVLASVFMHRGEASHGHYFLNQRKLSGAQDDNHTSSSSSSWYKYNDNVVTEATVSSVLKDTTGATPYLLSYVRKDLQHSVSLFETVCRQIEMLTTIEPDVVILAVPTAEMASNQQNAEDRTSTSNNDDDAMDTSS